MSHLKRLACDSKMSSKGTFYCVECNSLQCILCENENSDNVKHERLNLEEINNEFCSIDGHHPAVFYCPTCVASFCYQCYVNQHQHSDGREHKPRKSREGQVLKAVKNNDQDGIETKPIYPDLFSNLSNNNAQKLNSYTKPSASIFTDIKLNDRNENYISPSNRDNNLMKSKTSTSTVSQMNHNSDNARNNQENELNTDSNEVFLLLDANEHLTVNDEFAFIRQLKCASQDPSVKCVSIVGNTGDGKSYTLNRVFFNGEEKFQTTATTESCTKGVWSTLDGNQRTLILDTEGRLGLSQNDNIRNRLLLKILCISDIVIFRTRAPKLPNDMFQFLSDASNAFLKYFRKELENVMKNCKADGPMSTMGPTLIVFHETQHTEVLRDHIQCQKTAVEQLKERFEKMNLSYDAYSSIEYVGIQTTGGNESDFSEIKATITSTLENNKIRSPRRLSIIFKALKALNEKFNHAIPPEMPSSLPDDFFTCCFKCLSCGAKCTMAANHQKENSPHRCDEQCSYNKEWKNEVLKCLQCHREGRDTIVYDKKIATNDSLVEGYAKYVWSGSIIECPKHGKIFRYREHWYGNNEPKDVTRVEVIHVWPGEDNSRLTSDVTNRKVMEAVCKASSYLLAPAKTFTEKVTDQIAPPHWKANKDVHKCQSCDLEVGLEYSKHHCRECGDIFCDTCTTHRSIVPSLEVKTPERVCDNCYKKLQSQTLSSIFQNNNPNTQQANITDYAASSTNDSSSSPNVYMPIPRRLIDLVKTNVGPVMYRYTVELVKESARPDYWQSDSECHVCFVCQHAFNNTTYRLHHCRKCGKGVCDKCSPNERPVPERNWLTPVRVCKLCDESNSEHK